MESLIPIYGINQDCREKFLWEILLTEEKLKWFQTILEVMDDPLKYYLLSQLFPKLSVIKYFYLMHIAKPLPYYDFLQLSISKLCFSPQLFKQKISQVMAEHSFSFRVSHMFSVLPE